MATEKNEPPATVNVSVRNAKRTKPNTTVSVAKVNPKSKRKIKIFLISRHFGELPWGCHHE